MAMLPVDGSPSDSGLLVRAPGNASENVSASSGVLAGPVAGQGARSCPAARKVCAHRLHIQDAHDPGPCARPEADALTERLGAGL
jgi:hypothetical protein